MIPHGTYSGYKHHRCRCTPCKQACRDYVNHRSRMVAYGRWEPWGDPDQVREHISRLHDQGWSYRSVARAAGCSARAVQNLVSDPGRRVKADVAARVLAVGAGWPPGYVPAIGSVRRVRALTAAGWRLEDVSAASGGLSVSGVSKLRAGVQEWTQAATRSRVLRAYEVLGAGVPVGAGADRVRARAVALGWAPPAGWDEEWLDMGEEELGAELDRLVGLMDAAEWRRCYQAVREGDRSPLVVAGAEAYRRRESARKAQKAGLGVAA